MTTRLVVQTGDRFGRLEILSEAEGHRSPSGQKQRRFCVKCDCGAKFVVLLGSMRSGNTLSCGCLHRETTSALTHREKHEMTNSRTYTSWSAMLDRAHRRKKVWDAKFGEYAGRGITVCDRWIDFQNFLDDMGERPEETSIDRIDNDGIYEPGNCRWADRFTQASNRRTSRMVMLNGESICLAEASRRIGIDLSTAQDRVNRIGCTLQEAIDHYASKRAA